MQPVLRWLWLVLVSLVLVACSTMKSTSTATQSSTKSPNAVAALSGTSVQRDGSFDHRPVNPDPAKTAANSASAAPIPSNGSTFSFDGQDFTPKGDSAGYRATGTASWYGKEFHGRKTSTGERYNMYALTAAHKTMPIPSYARITNLSNGKSIVVRVNDRGPYHHKRVIDLSYAAADELDFVDKGSTRVRIEQVWPVSQLAKKPAAPVAQAAPAPQAVQIAAVPAVKDKVAFLQLGSYGNLSNAQSEMSTLLKKLSDDYDSKLGIVHEQDNYRIRLGPFDNDHAALRAANEIGVSPVILH